jgi:ankyrin repeat protein
MHHAAQKGKHIRLRSFMSGDVNALNKRATSLYLAASNGHLRCVTMLLDAKADVNALSNGKTPLMGASSYDHLKVVNALIKARADVNILSNDHGTALFYAACEKTDSHTIVAALLAAGAIVDAPGTMMSPLSTAVRSNSMKSFKLLIAAGADVEPCVHYHRHPSVYGHTLRKCHRCEAPARRQGGHQVCSWH